MCVCVCVCVCVCEREKENYGEQLLLSNKPWLCVTKLSQNVAGHWENTWELIVEKSLIETEKFTRSHFDRE